MKTIWIWVLLAFVGGTLAGFTIYVSLIFTGVKAFFNKLSPDSKDHFSREFVEKVLTPKKTLAQRLAEKDNAIYDEIQELEARLKELKQRR
jgi:hypothetical protein